MSHKGITPFPRPHTVPPPSSDSASNRYESIVLGAPPHHVHSRIVFENRSLLAIDKPAGWMLSPTHWTRTSRSLQQAIESSLQLRLPWVKRHNLRFLRFIHRLDADTTGVLLLAKSHGAIAPYSKLLQTRQVRKTYLAAVHGTPPMRPWSCQKPLGRDPRHPGRMRIVRKDGWTAETRFETLRPRTRNQPALVASRPLTGRTHQIRLHLTSAGCPVLGDSLYTPSSWITPPMPDAYPLALRAVALEFNDPFERRPVSITAPVDHFLLSFGWDADAWAPFSPGSQRAGKNFD